MKRRATGRRYRCRWEAVARRCRWEAVGTRWSRSFRTSQWDSNSYAKGVVLVTTHPPVLVAATNRYLEHFCACAFHKTNVATFVKKLTAQHATSHPRWGHFFLSDSIARHRDLSDSDLPREPSAEYPPAEKHREVHDEIYLEPSLFSWLP